MRPSDGYYALTINRRRTLDNKAERTKHPPERMGASESNGHVDHSGSLLIFLYERSPLPDAPPAWMRYPIATLAPRNGWTVSSDAARLLHRPDGGVDVPGGEPAAAVQLWQLFSVALQVSARPRKPAPTPAAVPADGGGGGIGYALPGASTDHTTCPDDNDSQQQPAELFTRARARRVLVDDGWPQTGLQDAWVLPLRGARLEDGAARRALYIVNPRSVALPELRDPPVLLTGPLDTSADDRAHDTFAARVARGIHRCLCPAPRRPDAPPSSPPTDQGEEARPHFVPVCNLQERGNRSETCQVGYLFGADDSTAVAKAPPLVVGKLMQLDVCYKSEVCFLPPGGQNAPVPPAWEDACSRLETLERLLRDPELQHPNVLRIVHYDTDIIKTFSSSTGGLVMRRIRTYTPWMAGGSLEDVRVTGVCGPGGPGVARLDAVRLQAVCADAWEGLAHLNRIFLHGDIKPANVLIELLPAGGVRGVVADIDDMITRTAAERAATESGVGPIVVMSTPFYGSPFPHGDVRRDQTAMLLTTLHTLGPVNWIDHCVAALAKGTPSHQREMLRSKWGYAVDEALEIHSANRPDLWPHYRRGIYTGYADAIVTHLRSSACGEQPLSLAPLIDRLRVLDSTDRDANWDYDTVREVTVQRLRQRVDVAKETNAEETNTTNASKKKRPLSPPETR